MKKSVCCTVCATMVLFMVFASCGMGLDPARSDTGSVVLSVPAVAANASAPGGGRAIIPDGGYLYVRMIGGPTADTPSFLGPFRVSGTLGATITIPGIQAGSYDGMFVLYAATEVHKEMYGAAAQNPFSTILLLPDDEFVDLIEGDETATVPDDLDYFFNGRASCGVVENAVIRAGTTNIFTVPMEPITPHWVDFNSEATTSKELYASSIPEKGFFVNCFGFTASSGPSFSVRLGSVSGSTFTIHRVAIYDETGRLLGQYTPNTVVLSGGQTQFFTAPFNGEEDIYVYVGYSGTLVDMSFIASVVPTPE